MSSFPFSRRGPSSKLPPNFLCPNLRCKAAQAAPNIPLNLSAHKSSVSLQLFINPNRLLRRCSFKPKTYKRRFSKVAHLFLSLSFFLFFLLFSSFFSLIDNWKLPFNHRQKVYPNGTLMIYQVERDHDEGLYTCLAKGKQGSIAKNSLFVSILGEFQCSRFCSLNLV